MKRVDKRVLYVALSAILTVGLGSCRSSLPEWETKHGMVSLKTDYTESQTTRSEPANVATLRENATVNIYNVGENRGLIRTFKGLSTLPDNFYLATGNYRVDILSFDTEGVTASFTDKAYKGRKEFSVSPAATTDIQVECKINSTGVELILDPTINANLTEWSFKAGYDLTDSSKSLTYTSSTASTGYFTLPEGTTKIDWSFAGALADGTKVNKSGTIYDPVAGTKYKLTFRYTVTSGQLELVILVDTDVEEKTDDIVFEPDQTGATSPNKYDVWAKFANLYANVNESEYGQSTLQFGYRTTGTTAWSTLTAVREQANYYKAILTGLTPESGYEYALLVDGAVAGNIRSFTTEAVAALPNGSFEEWNNDAGYPMPYSSGAGAWRGNANKASDMVSKVICESDTDAADGTYSAKLAAKGISILTINKLAPGNLFSGSFVQTVGTEGGIVDFGRPFTARPTGLKLHYKYNCGTIDYYSSLPSNVDQSLYQKGKNDIFSIYIMVGDWSYKTFGGTSTSPVRVNTTNQSTFMNLSGENVIAVAELTKQETVSDWTEVTLKLNYLREQATPTHIIISCASSKFGDYFTGSSNSTLWVDGMELIYDYIE